MTVEEYLATPQSIAALIDQTLLKPEATETDMIRLCEEAREHGFAAVCVNPHWLRLVVQQLHGSCVRPCTVIGFPLGANDSRTKLAEAALALSQGALELDMVQNVGALRSGDFHLVHKEIADLADLAHSKGAILKVILETCLLTDGEKTTVCRLAVEGKADFVKTSTGFATGGATTQDVALMRRAVGAEMGVKASGGIRSFETLASMVRAGATRIGASSGVQILREYREGTTAGLPLPLSAAKVPGGNPDSY